jgi:CheY-like chemotaxis protein
MLSILLIGDAERTEFRDARAGLDRWGTVHAFAETDQAIKVLTNGEVVPDMIVVAQSFPGQYSHEAVDHLRRLAPLARVIGLMGSWCEGEMRTGLPWPGAVRTYWHQWTSRSNREFNRLLKGQCGAWTLPPTASEEERLLADRAKQGDELSFQRGLVLIHTQSHDMAQCLSAACRSWGFATVWQHPTNIVHVEGAVAAIFDSGDLRNKQCSLLRHLTRSIYPLQVIALLAFPRIEDRNQALSAGAAAVLSKPLVLADLFDALERCCEACRGR